MINIKKSASTGLIIKFLYWRFLVVKEVNFNDK